MINGLPDEQYITLKQWAWKELEGWGHKKPDGVHVWDIQTRMTHADELVAWVMSPVGDPDEHEDEVTE